MSEQTAQETVQGGAYEVIRRRLEQQARLLSDKAQALNERRTALFGSTRMEVIGSARIRTENNCVPRDIAGVDGLLLFGYNVFIGLKAETRVEDVLSLQHLEQGGEGFEVAPALVPGTFLADDQFVRDFRELYAYYKGSRLSHLRVLSGKLLATFRTGRTREDVKVFRWALLPGQPPKYIDNRGERDDVYPPAHDFEWRVTTRDHYVLGRHPHVSIEDQVFVETVGGDLTIKVENNTEDGLGIYREPVQDGTQSLGDADIHYARVGALILLKVRPYRERVWRYLVYNPRGRRVDRIDAIGQACLQLPEDHGLIFPGGCYLQSGDVRFFEGDIANLEIKRTLRSPNGEDVLYVFHHHDEGRMLLLSYNLIRKELQNPIVCHGYSLFDDGRAVVFRADSAEPTRVHPIQVWQTPYASDEHAASRPTDGSYLARIGNAELVRGISDAYTIRRMLDNPQPTMGSYEELVATATRVQDSYHWLGHPEVGDLLSILREIRATAELAIGELEKVDAMRRRADEALAAAAEAQRDLIGALRSERLRDVAQFIDGLSALRSRRGQLITLREMRYVDLARIEALEQELVDRFAWLSGLSVDFLLRDNALAPYHERLQAHSAAIDAGTKAVDLAPIAAALKALGEGLDLLTEVLGTLQMDDATKRTRILEGISEIYARLNGAKAGLDLKAKALRAGEARAEFGAQFLLYSQSVTNALGLAETPERCDEQLSRLLVQLEGLESRFSEHEDYLADLAAKREEVYEAFEARKQSLVEERQRRSQNLYAAAQRVLQSVRRRAQTFTDADELNGFFASDAMALKARELAGALRGAGDGVRADDVETRLKTARDQAIRSLRDRQDIYEAGGTVIRLGRHRFSVNTQPLDLTLLPVEAGIVLHLSGTDLMQPIEDPELEAARSYWDQDLVSETVHVYRGEYLAASVLLKAESGFDGLDMDGLRGTVREADGLLALVRQYAASRYDEGYERGVHDHDAALILGCLLELYGSAGLLRFRAEARALACLFWACDGTDTHAEQRGRWRRRARSLGQLAVVFGQHDAGGALAEELAQALGEFHRSLLPLPGLPEEAGLAGEAAAYLAEELKAETPRFLTPGEAINLVEGLSRQLEQGAQRHAFEADLEALRGDLRSRFGLARAWLAGYARRQGAHPPALLTEAAAIVVTAGRLDREPSSALCQAEVDGLLGRHPRLVERRLGLRLDETLTRLRQFRATRVPGFRAYRKLRQSIIERERRLMRLDELTPGILSAFVRNKLIDEAYLPLIGDNLAKQMGAVGEGKRTDLMGLLLLISPPGYGKTTLMEYLANRLGLVFMKIDCPAVGHRVSSLDPAEAPNATARQELVKLNLALEMGNNVMLYLDDIQHTGAELLQKFISLSDAQRRIEGVWRGQAKTYDMRGKRFCVVMAGNPYTESGEVFKIPDMLANRADIYNLGDVLGGREALFALSYLENAITSNPALAPLAGRGLEDFYRLVRRAQGEQVSNSELEHAYSAAELQEITGVLRHLMRVRDVLLLVNRQYIASASQQDAYRGEPAFKLQGSYRNMNKLAEKVVAVMNAAEIDALIDDHYQGEAQTLTTGAEENLLKLAELRGVITDAQRERWREILKGFRRIQVQGGAESDPAVRIGGQLSALGETLRDIRDSIESAGARSSDMDDARAEQVRGYLQRLQQTLDTLADARLDVEIVNQPLPGLQDLLTQLVGAIDGTLLPMMKAMHHKLTLDESIWRHVIEANKVLKRLDQKSLGSQTSRRRSYRPFRGGQEKDSGQS